MPELFHLDFGQMELIKKYPLAVRKLQSIYHFKKVNQHALRPNCALQGPSMSLRITQRAWLSKQMDFCVGQQALCPDLGGGTHSRAAPGNRCTHACTHASTHAPCLLLPTHPAQVSTASGSNRP